MLKRALYASALLLPLTLAGVAPAAADGGVSFGLGIGSPYYGYPHSYGLFDPYGPYYGPAVVDDDMDDDMDDDIDVEPAAAPAQAAGCVKTNVKNFKNACPT